MKHQRKSPTADRLPPHSVEAEEGVLACCVLDPDQCIDESQARFKAAGSKVFYSLPVRTIFDMLVGMRKDGEAIDVITLQARLSAKGILNEVGGIAYLSALPDKVPSAANLSYYLDIVWEKYLRRKLLRVCTHAADQVYEDGTVESLIGKVENAVSGIETDEVGIYGGHELANRLVDNMQARFENWSAGKRSGLVTGFQKLDYLTDGLQFGEQTIIAARPSVGKTALALNIVNRVCILDQLPALMVTFEMSAEALTRRLFAANQGVNMGALRTGNFTEGEHTSFATFTTMLNNRPLHIVDAVSGMDANQLSAIIRRVWKKHGLKLVVIDYLQKIRAAERHEKRTYEVGSVSGVLKGLAVETKCAFLTLAQLNREPEKEKGRLPRLSDLADSGQIERDGDCIGLLHRDRNPEKAHETKLIIGKQRDGEIGSVDLTFVGQFCRFENPTVNQEQE